MTVGIRPARPQDAEAIAALARDLNIHVGSDSHGFEADDVRRDGFGKDPAFEVIVAEQDGAVVGYTLLHPSYESGWGARGVFMADLFIAEAARGGGIGRRLVQAAARRTREKGGRYMCWVTDTDNAEARAFYKRLGAKEETIVECHVADEALDALVDAEISS